MNPPLNTSDKTLYISLQEKKLINGHKLSKEEEESLERIKSMIKKESDKVTALILNIK